MKKLMFAFCLLVGTALAVSAQDSTATTPTVDQSSQYRSEDNLKHDQDHDHDMNRKEIPVSQLPALVQEQLKSQDYSRWIVGKAYSHEKKDGETTYAVELKNGDDIKLIKFDAQGNVVKEREKEDKDQ
jgi:hypothetical protein